MNGSPGASTRIRSGFIIAFASLSGSPLIGNLVKKQTGKSAQEYIQERLIDRAKERVLDTSKAISEIAYELGFNYPSHFTRLFKQSVGLSPNAYRHVN